MKFLLSLLCLIVFASSMHAQEKLRPKIGLTLSGGGAKGLAHIGILKAIDSAGLKVDYITGTSMGGILGALYAVGYSGNEIEKIAREIDWDQLFGNQISLRTLSVEEKEQYSRFAIELPYVNNRISLQTGVIKGQELNMKFSELFFHVSDVRDFNQFKIPFKCMATDLETGNLVVLDTGNITTALRATMAIPSIFSAVNIGDKRLVDGGVVRNFPVKNVKEMGADIVIGSNVSTGLSAKEKITNPIDVILQMAFFKEAGDFKEEIPLTNYYIYMPLEKYNMGSFGSSGIILDEGLEAGRSYYTVFKKLADSINALAGNEPERSDSINAHTVFITGYKVTGLKKTSAIFLAHLMNFDDNRTYTAAQINKSIRRAYGSRYYNNINYTLDHSSADTASIIFNVEENPSTHVKAGLYYTRFRGINVNLNLTSRDLFIPNSRSMVSLSLGESIQLEAEHLQYLGRIKNIAFQLGFRLDNQEINSYTNFKADGSYKQNYSQTYLNFQNSGNNKVAAGIGTAFEYIHFGPAIRSASEIKGNFTNFKSYAFLKYNSLNQIFYPTKGMKLNMELAHVYNQKPRITQLENGQPIPGNLNFDDYSRLYFDGTIFAALNSKFNFFTGLQAGINFTSNSNELNDFLIGGINGSFRNQVKFAGLQEATLHSSSVGVLQLGLRYNPVNNFYLIGRVNGLVKDFITGTSSISGLTGYALTFAYRTPIGPLELSAMYSDQSRRLQSYVLFGITF
ncbi:MAG: patatin-like phospholipase family protein [Ferruginibacter sp.]|nr:patatin-like phospholipase family protein [Chitinophagaceae bacterium]MBP6286760.1 patatin-like phospholipase family protein [Ferruginibacter sp.]